MATTTIFTLSEIQPIFGREIAGNHTVAVIDADGWQICQCWVEIDDRSGMVYFTMDDENSDWCLMSKNEFQSEVKRAKAAR
jgi:hypothetical protein